MNYDEFNDLIGQIYDCALDPSGWSGVLAKVSQEIDSAYAAITIAEFHPGELEPRYNAHHSPWDERWIAALQTSFPLIPRLDKMRDAPLDSPLTQLDLVPEPEFRLTEFYRRWAEPQNLLDTMNTAIVRRDATIAWLVLPTFTERARYSADDLQFAARIAPHLRRALLIGGMLEATAARARLNAQLLDQLTVAICLVDERGRLMQSNAAAEALFTKGDTVTAAGGFLRAVSPVHRAALAESIARACTGDDSDLGLWGNGMPLNADLSDPCVAYVLPMGASDKRHALGPGQAAVFIRREGSQPPAVELLSALSGLSSAEAAVAIAVASGQSPQDIAAAQGVSVHTVRKHLAHVYDKTGYRTQSAVAAFVSGLGPPILPALAARRIGRGQV